MKTSALSAAQKKHLHSLMKQAYIPGLSIATITHHHIASSQLGVAHADANTPLDENTRFWACSLSKPVFAFLIITLIKNEVLPTQFLDEALPWDENILGKQGEKKPLTARMILSHQTGLQNSGSTNFKFNPGDGFRYSGDGYLYLQKILEEKTGKKLEALAQTRLFKPLAMTNTSFLYPDANTPTAKAHDESLTPNPLPKMPANHENAAASLHTTAVDYAKFLLACIQDANFTALITPQIHSMTKDVDAKEKLIDADTLNRIDWGLGVGLEKNQSGEVVSLFHWGHGPGTRAFFNVKISNSHDPSAATGFVYLTNSENGLAIANEIAALTGGDVSPIMRFLSLKYDYKDIHTPHWHDYHDRMIAAKQAENNGDYASAIKHYQQAMDIRPDKQAELRYRILKIEIHELKKETPDIALLTGQYGPIQITQQDSRLQINDGGPDGPRKLETINDHLFLDGAVILDFKRQRNKQPTALSCFFPNGENPSFHRLTSTASIAKTMGVPAAALLTQNEATPKPKTAAHPPWAAPDNNPDIAAKILNKIWEEKILRHGEHSATLQSFMKTLFPTQAWVDAVNRYFNIPENRHDKMKFDQLFGALSFAQLVTIDEGEHFGITQRIELNNVTLNDEVKSQIAHFLSTQAMTAATSLSTSGQAISAASNDALYTTPLCIYSVTKIFTGVLVLLMVRENIIQEEDLQKPIQLSDEVNAILAELSPALAAHATKTTLHQVMTHNAGFGDFTPRYVAAIQAALDDPSKHAMPSIKQTHDLLRFDDKQIHQEQKYSNTGSLLVGLAIERAYYKKFGEPLSFDDILRKYLINNVSPNNPISCFSKTMPPNGRHGANMPEAKHMVASPAGGYWATMDDLRKLGEHLCHLFKDPQLNQLLKKYGQEFTKNKGDIIFHDGAAPNASAVLYASLTTGAVIATAAIHSKTDAKTLANAIEVNVFTAPQKSTSLEVDYTRKQKR